MDTISAKDEEHLKLLATFHYVLAGLIALMALFPVFHLLFGILMIVAPESMESGGDPPPAFFGWFFVIFASVFMITAWILAAFVLITGRFLAARKRRTFCIVMGGIECAFMPLGTVLGVFTILVLMRESVEKLFDGKQAIESERASDEFEKSF